MSMRGLGASFGDGCEALDIALPGLRGAISVAKGALSLSSESDEDVSRIWRDFRGCDASEMWI